MSNVRFVIRLNNYGKHIKNKYLYHPAANDLHNPYAEKLTNDIDKAKQFNSYREARLFFNSYREARVFFKGMRLGSYKYMRQTSDLNDESNIEDRDDDVYIVPYTFISYNSPTSEGLNSPKSELEILQTIIQGLENPRLDLYMYMFSIRDNFNDEKRTLYNDIQDLEDISRERKMTLMLLAKLCDEAMMKNYEYLNEEKTDTELKTIKAYIICIDSYEGQHYVRTSDPKDYRTPKGVTSLIENAHIFKQNEADKYVESIDRNTDENKMDFDIIGFRIEQIQFQV